MKSSPADQTVSAFVAAYIQQRADLGERTMVRDDVGTLQTTVILPAAGRWRVQVGIRVDEFTNPVGTLSFAVRAR